MPGASTPEGGAAHQFESEVFPAELRDIAARRRAAGSERGSAPPPQGTSTRHDLVGLSFSGGGIRSATFHLGVLQALERRGVLRHVDYLSTVSGGGFIGASLAALMRKPGARFPFAHRECEGEPRALSYLRDHSNYLAPDGAFDYVRMVALVTRGIFLNALVLVPFVVALSLIVTLLYGGRLATLAQDPDASIFDWDLGHWLTPWALTLAVGWILAYPAVTLVYRLLLFRWRQRRERVSRGSLWWRDLYERSYVGTGLLFCAALFVDAQPLFVHWFHRFYVGDDARSAVVLAGAALLGAFALSRAVVRLRKVGQITAMLLVALAGPLIPFLGHLLLTNLLVYHEGLEPILGLPPSVAIGGVAMAIGLLCYFLIDVNSTSMHVFYRDRLSRAFIVSEDAAGRVTPEDDLSLRELCAEGSTAPYSLLCAVVNLQGSKDIALRGRDADTFIFSKRYLGSERTGYCRVEDMEAIFPYVHLGSAVAVSGAAAAPNMGSYKTRAFTFLLALLNVRLGYWLPNPCRVRDCAARRRVRATLWRAGPTLLLREMLSAVHEHGRAINVSDGGHLEELGLYELLRRRCRFIIAGDATQDPDLTFEGLAALLRYARIDLGIEIELQLDDVRPLSEGDMSRRHFAFARIRYPARDGQPAETGHLLFLKSSLTGDEDEHIKHYRRADEDFPHQTTADQFFDEAQFEAYRSLGYHIVDQLFAEAQVQSFDDLARWFGGLEASVTPEAPARAPMVASG